MDKPASDAALQEYYDKNCHRLLPIIAEKEHQAEGETSERGSDLDIRNVSGSPEPRRGRPESPRKKDSKRKTMFKWLEKIVFHKLGDKGKTYSNDSRHQLYHSSHKDTESYYQSSRSRGTKPTSDKHHNKIASSHKKEAMSESEGSAGGYWKSRSKKQRSSIKDDDLSQP
nr:hypothetical protein [Tanacetum cinerariifolium]